MRLVLASASPRRRALLEAAGVRFEVRPADVDETWTPGEPPVRYARRVATEKAAAVQAGTDAAVLAADTVVALGGTVFGKPADAEEARRILGALSGREHRVHTAVALLSGGRVRARVVTTRVRFRELSRDDVEGYIATGEPFDKAGAYGIQGHGGALVDRVAGSYTNVIGLPLRETLELLTSAGVR